MSPAVGGKWYIFRNICFVLKIYNIFNWLKLHWSFSHHITVKPVQKTTSKTATQLRWSMLSLLKQIPTQLLLYKPTNATSNLFFCLPNENLSKTTNTKLYPVKKWEINIRQQCIQKKHLSDYIYSTTTLQCKVCLTINTGQFITSYKIIYNYVKSNKIICFFFLHSKQRHFWNKVKHLRWGFFEKKS